MKRTTTLRQLPTTAIPTGWFEVRASSALANGEVASARYFGEDLVLYRGESGRPNVFEAFCPHLGAHLGFGGRVDGDDIVCPFHGWRWDTEGNNVEIPYSDRLVKNLHLRSWPTFDDGVSVWTWSQSAPAVPSVSAPALPTAEGSWQVVAQCEWLGIETHPLLLAQTVARLMRIELLHGEARPQMEDYLDDGERFSITLRSNDGRRSVIEFDGPGVITTRGDLVERLTCTPVDSDLCDIRLSVLAQPDDGRTPSGDHIAKVVQRTELDVAVASHATYIDDPALLDDEDIHIVALRDWFHRFTQQRSTT